MVSRNILSGTAALFTIAVFIGSTIVPSYSDTIIQEKGNGRSAFVFDVETGAFVSFFESISIHPGSSTPEKRIGANVNTLDCIDAVELSEDQIHWSFDKSWVSFESNCGLVNITLNGIPPTRTEHTEDTTDYCPDYILTVKVNGEIRDAIATGSVGDIEFNAGDFDEAQIIHGEGTVILSTCPP